jgi:hypothetical protein
MSKHIFSKIAKIGEEVRAAEVIKVEFANENIKSLIAGLKAQNENLEKARDNSAKLLTDLTFIDDKARATWELTGRIIRNVDSGIMKDAVAVKNQLRQQANELGVNVNDIQLYKDLIDLEIKIKQSWNRAVDVNDKLFNAIK